MIEVVIFISGLVAGSFLNVCIYRIPRKMSLLHPGSSCPHCGKKIPFYHNIPVLSYILLRGSCSNCGKRISIQYPIVEVLSGLTFLFLYWRFGFGLELPFYVIFSFFLIVIAFIDIETQLIHNRVLIALGLAGILLNYVLQVIPWTEAALGVAAGGGSMLLFAWAGKVLFKKEAMGMGDVKFSAAAGMFLGWKTILVALYTGFVLALITVLLLRLFNKLNLESRIPLGPFLASGLLLFILLGDWFTRLYLEYMVL